MLNLPAKPDLEQIVLLASTQNYAGAMQQNSCCHHTRLQSKHDGTLHMQLLVCSWKLVTIKRRASWLDGHSLKATS